SLNDNQHHKIERLRENGTRLLNLINDILDLTRIEARRVEITAKPFEFRPLIMRLASQVEVLAQDKGLAFEVDIAADMPEKITGDEKRLEQIIVNLLSNAFKFTSQGKVALKVWTTEQTWQIAVSDTGIGIPPHARSLIFEEFRQLDGSSNRVYKGTGLGLAITRNLVRLMDGQITVDSELGKGSIFTVTLPLVQAEQYPQLLGQILSAPELVETSHV
ncbi:MAG TPA: ATP-binding protein, partial [Anaerolineales bacterium]|nr:ATP-binding protein [Anaerolineales bacterium]